MYSVFKKTIEIIFLAQCTLSLESNSLFFLQARRQDTFNDTIRFENEVQPRIPCQLQGSEFGVCKKIEDCPQLSSLLEDPTLRNLEILQHALCGYTESSPKVCCPKSLSVPTPLPRPQRPPQIAEAVPVPAVILNPRPPSLSVIQQQRPSVKPSERPLSKKLPSILPKKCGQQTTLSTRVVGGKQAQRGAWPWLAALVYRIPGNLKSFGCVGSLISKRHVLTAAHCIPDIEDITLQSARLGAHNLPHLGIDTEEFSEDVTPFVDIPVEKIVVHPEYVKKQLSKNDIAILKLARDAVFNDYVQPICIPVDNAVENKNLDGKTTYVAGWGATSFKNKAPSPVLLQASVPIVNSTLCKASYGQVKTKVVIDESVLCAGDGKGLADSCQGDSGGPLMHEINGAFYAIGVVSSGHKCAEPGFYGVYMRTTHYLDWIFENIK